MSQPLLNIKPRGKPTNIEKTIQSVLSQTFRDYEFVIIDGGSTDGSLDVIAKYRDEIDLVISERDEGIYHAMNKGIENSNGEYLLFLNGGDYLFDKSTLQNIFKEKSSADIIYGNLLFDDTEGRVNSGERFIARPRKKITALTFFFPGIPLYHPGSIIKKSLFLSYGPYCESFKILGDYEFFLRVIAKHKVSTRYLSVIFTVFNTLGIASKKHSLSLRKHERKQALKSNIPIFRYCLYMLTSRVYIYFNKKNKRN